MHSVYFVSVCLPAYNNNRL